MVGHQNETKRHFELRNLDRDMERASEKAARVVPNDTARRFRAKAWGSIIVLLILVGLLAYLLGVF